MTSKEALNILSDYIGRLGGGETLEEEDIILNDLELLEKYKDLIIFLEKYYSNIDLDKLKRHILLSDNKYNKDRKETKDGWQR